MTSCPTTLPASWYTSKAMNELERRSVFAKTWTLMGIVTRWPNVGEDYAYEMAQTKFSIRRASEDWHSIRVFEEPSGLEIRSHLTATGLLFITLSQDTISFASFFPGLEDLIKGIDFTQLTPRRSLNYVGHYNWKTMMDGYQECLHCPYSHPTFSKIYKFVTYKILNKHNYSQHLAASDKPNDGLFLYFFPNSTLNLYGGGMSSFRACPTGDPRVTMMDFDYYHMQPVETEEFRDYFKLARTVAIEDHDLCERAQLNLDVGVYAEGILNPSKENGVIYYQSRVLDMCAAQHEMETEERVWRENAQRGVEQKETVQRRILQAQS